MATESGESMFERLCVSLGLVATRIPEVGSAGERRPDFEVTGTDGTKVHAEVKIISPNREESELLRRFYRGEIFAMGGEPGDRLRRLINKANGQLKSLAVKGLPGMLVVFNPEFLLSWHTESYSVLTAMRGLDVMGVTVHPDPHLPPVFGELRPGPKKRMTPKYNTSTSAIICPREVEPGTWVVPVYHNRHATLSLPMGVFAHPSVRHFRLSLDERQWVEVVA